MAIQRKLSRRLRAKTPRTPVWKRLAIVLILSLTVLILICASVGAVFLTSPGWLGEQSQLLSVLLSATPATTPDEHATATETVTPSLTPSAPTSTLAPGEELPPSATPTATLTPTPLPTPDGEEREIRVPILMYHYISVPPPDSDVYRQDLSVSPGNFRSQMAWLKENGYQTISLYDLIYALNLGWPPLPDKPIILTFDDGYVDNYKSAFPILQEFGYTGIFFILTDVTDRRQSGYMTWPMLQDMSQAGMSIEVHGREHVEMVGRDHDWLVYHLLGPAQTIEANLGYQSRFLSYPAGRYDADVIAAAQAQGYWGAVTVASGTLQSSAAPFELRRMRVRGEWSLATFVSVLEEFMTRH